MTRAMHEKLHRNKDEMDMAHVESIMGNAEEVPLEDSSVNVVTSNGVLNLVPDKAKAFAEIYRVLKPGGCFQISDIVIHKNYEALDQSKANPQLWAECIVGAMHENDYVNALAAAGFGDVQVVDRIDYFAASNNVSTRETAEYFETESITVKGVKK
jgi:ubiquinone/menaquinone biosynthesis C-methylase UbiE